jgi:hypothetical protein
MTLDANRREYALIEAATAGDVAAAGALLDHLREHDEEALANELAPLLAIEGGAQQIVSRLAMQRISRLLKAVSIPIADALTAFRKALRTCWQLRRPGTQSRAVAGWILRAQPSAVPRRTLTTHPRRLTPCPSLAPPPQRWAVVCFLYLMAFLVLLVLVAEVIPALFHSP